MDANQIPVTEILHGFRKQIDQNIQQAELFLSEPDNYVSGTIREKALREMDIALEKLQEAKMWVGKCLERLGSELPAEYADKA